MVHWEKDYKMGKKGEASILPTIKEYFKRDIKEYPEQYSKYDFFDDCFEYEVKTRTNRMNAFDDTMITENKLRDDKPLILIFNFTDKIAFIEYNKERFNNYERKMFSRARVQEDEKTHVYIPITDLTVIHEKPRKVFPAYQNIQCLFSD